MRHQKLSFPPGMDGAVWLMQGELHEYVGLHTHDEPEINLVVQDDARFRLTPGTLIWLLPEQQHVLIDTDPDLRMWITVIGTQALGRWTRTRTTQPLTQAQPDWVFCKHLPEPATDRLNRLFQTSLDTKPPWRFNAALAHLWMECWGEHLAVDDSASSDQVDARIATICRRLRDEPHPENIDTLAEQVGLSPAHLSRQFKKQTGVSLTQYRQRAALQRFVEIYGTGEQWNVTEAALKAGFGSYPQFNRVFRQHFGYTPADYRQRVKQQR